MRLLKVFVPFLLAFMLGGSGTGFSQKPDFRFKRITPLNGLSHSFVKIITQDHEG